MAQANSEFGPKVSLDQKWVVWKSNGLEEILQFIVGQCHYAYVWFGLFVSW